MTSQWTALTGELGVLIHRRDERKRAVVTRRERLERTEAEYLEADIAFQEKRRELLEAFPELAGSAGILHVPESMEFGTNPVAAPFVVPEREEAAAVRDARAKLGPRDGLGPTGGGVTEQYSQSGLDRAVHEAGCPVYAELPEACWQQHPGGVVPPSWDASAPISVQDVDRFLAQVELDRSRPYWSGRQDQLDGCRSWLESLRDHLTVPDAPLIREVPKDTGGKGQACHAGLHDACRNGGSSEVPCECECHGRPDDMRLTVEEANAEVTASIADAAARETDPPTEEQARIPAARECVLVASLANGLRWRLADQPSECSREHPARSPIDRDWVPGDRFRHYVHPDGDGCAPELCGGSKSDPCGYDVSAGPQLDAWAVADQAAWDAAHSGGHTSLDRPKHGHAFEEDCPPSCPAHRPATPSEVES